MRQLITLCIFCLTTQLLTAQNTFPTTGNAGVGTISPSSNLEVKQVYGGTGNIIKASGINSAFDGTRVYGTPTIYSQIGINGDNTDIGGLTYFNDGYILGMGLTSTQKLVCSYGQYTDLKYFRVLSPTTNMSNFSLEFSTRPTGITSSVWYTQGGATVAALNQPLNIGSGSSYPVKIYSDGGNANKVADIYVRYSQVGIGTEAPNANARLDVNGNIYSNGKIFIGTADGTTTSKISAYSLAVDGSAIFTKAVVKLQNAWPDYVFHSTYKMPELSELEAFIKQHGHLPEVPTANEVEKEGIDVGSNQALLLKKIEELTLIVIEQNKRIEKLEKEQK